MTPEAHGIAGDLTRQAIALADGMFPSRHSSLPDEIRVPVALLARCVSIAKSNLHLGELDTQLDAFVCLRTLYEHTTMLAWLLGDDTRRRLLLWQRYSDEQTLRLDREMGAASGQSRVPDETKRSMEEAAAEDLGRPKLPGLADRAVEADREWDARVRAIDPQRGFMLPLRDFYTVFYRPASAVAHPTLAGLQFVTTRSPASVEIHLEQPRAELAVLVGVPVLLAMGYLAVAHLIGEPSMDQVKTLVDAFGNPPNRGSGGRSGSI